MGRAGMGRIDWKPVGTLWRYKISCRDIRKHGQLIVNNDGLEEFKCAQFLSVTMFLYSVKTLLLYGGGSLLLYLGMAQFITPSKEEEIRKLYGVPKHEKMKSEAKKEMVMSQMKFVAGLDKQTKPKSDSKS
ncbi:hypothetical protein LSH36_1g12008 [Paralvinella palmiformis]|uniref:Uncharacterized protein n=1 Tax=Paralvinella palmiformis TaxID=53620 RepID=A0AAD9NHW5_9ANNE|nr:hypothetical protein LSH36_1g12008 [Paralvinella palmiformis]